MVEPVVRTRVKSGLWDGFVSNLRTYSVRELNDLVGQVNDDGYEWQIGKRRSLDLSRVTYVIGNRASR